MRELTGESEQRTLIKMIKNLFITFKENSAIIEQDGFDYEKNLFYEIYILTRAKSVAHVLFFLYCEYIFGNEFVHSIFVNICF